MNPKLKNQVNDTILAIMTKMIWKKSQFTKKGPRKRSKKTKSQPKWTKALIKVIAKKGP